VRYLLPLAHEVKGKLKELGRYKWFLESCEAAQTRVKKREGGEKESWRISGSGRLQPAGLRFLRAIWNWRDGEAASWNRPSFMVATNKQLIAWATDLAEGREINLPPKLRPDRSQRLRALIKEAEGIPESEWPVRPKRVRQRYDQNFEQKLKEVMESRNETAEDLGIDPSVIASRGVLEQIIGGRVDPVEILLKWQLSLLDL
jgi:ribonuclease D